MEEQGERLFRLDWGEKVSGLLGNQEVEELRLLRFSGEVAAGKEE